MITVAAALSAVQHAMGKLYGRHSGRGMLPVLFFPACTSAMIAVLTLALTGFSPHLNAFGVAMAATQSLLCGLFNMLGIYVTQKVGSGVFTAFVMLGGMLVPFFSGVAFLGERPSAFCVTGVALAIAALVFSALSAGKNSASADKRGRGAAVALCFVILLLNGVGSSVMKFHQVDPRAVDPLDYMLAGNTVSAVVHFAAMGAVALAGKARKKPSPAGDVAPSGDATARSVPMMLTSCGIYTVTSTVAGFLQMKAATVLPASVQFPFVTAGTVIFATVLGAIMFREKINRWTAISLVLMLAGTVLFNL